MNTNKGTDNATPRVNGVVHEAQTERATRGDEDQTPISHQARQLANEALIKYMMSVLQDGRKEANNLYGRLRWAYWIMITLTLTLFLVGLLLLSSPLWVPAILAKMGASDNFNWFATFLPPALGIADLLALYLYNPVRRINKLMGDMSQLIIILNSYNLCVAVRLVEFDVEERPTVGAAAVHMKTITGYSLSSIARHFEQGLNDVMSDIEPLEGSANG